MDTKKMPTYSIIIPVYKSEKTLNNTLFSIFSSKRDDIEVIVIIDGSPDNSFEIASKFPCSIIKSEENRGISVSRNLGIENAKGDYLIFTDSDICFTHNTLKTIDQSISKGEIIVGIYSEHHPHQNIASQYKNLWIRYSYLKSPENINWIFGAISVVKSSIFQETNLRFQSYFNNNTLWGGEDIELGWKLYKKGYKIFLNKSLEVIHCKSYSLYTLLKNDFFRSAGYLYSGLKTRGIKEILKKRSYGNISYKFLLSIFIIYFIIIIFVIFQNLNFLILITSILAYLVLNFPFLYYLYKVKNFPFAFFSLWILILDHFVCAIGLIVGLICIFYKLNHKVITSLFSISFKVE